MYCLLKILREYPAFLFVKSDNPSWDTISEWYSPHPILTHLSTTPRNQKHCLLPGLEKKNSTFLYVCLFLQGKHSFLKHRSNAFSEGQSWQPQMPIDSIM